MSVLFNCSLMCALISVWGTVQLGAMSIFYFSETVDLIEDCEAHDTKSYSEYIEKTKKNFKATGTNCLIAAVIYLVTLLVSIGCIWRERKKDRLRAAQLEDDEISCLPPPAKPEIMVKQTPRTNIVAKLMRKKDKQATVPQLTQNKPLEVIETKDMEDKKIIQEAGKEEIKKKKIKDKKKTKQGQD